MLPSVRTAHLSRSCPDLSSINLTLNSTQDDDSDSQPLSMMTPVKSYRTSERAAPATTSKLASQTQVFSRRHKTVSVSNDTVSPTRQVRTLRPLSPPVEESSSPLPTNKSLLNRRQSADTTAEQKPDKKRVSNECVLAFSSLICRLRPCQRNVMPRPLASLVQSALFL